VLGRVVVTLADVDTPAVDVELRCLAAAADTAGADASRPAGRPTLGAAVLPSTTPTLQFQSSSSKKGKVFPYSLPSVGPGADPGVQAVSPQVT